MATYKKWSAVVMMQSPVVFAIDKDRMNCAINGDLYDSAGSASIIVRKKYKFLDSAGDVNATDFRITETAANLPTDVLAALQTVDAYLAQAEIDSGL